MTVVRVADLRAAGVGPCERTLRWCERNGMDWHDFARNGIDAERLRHISDGRTLIDLAIAAAERREARDGQ